MKRVENHHHRRARCSAIRTLKSGVLAVAVVFLPKLMLFVERGVISRSTLSELMQALLVATLMVAFNYAQHLHAEESRRLRRRQQHTHERTERGA